MAEKLRACAPAILRQAVLQTAFCNGFYHLLPLMCDIASK